MLHAGDRPFARVWFLSRLLATCATFGGCAEETETVRFENEADEVCMAALLADASALEVTLTFDACASYCATVTSTDCQAQVDGTVVRLQGSATLDLPRSGLRRGGCPTACQQVRATCRLEGGPSEGETAVVQLGEDEFEMVVLAPGGCEP